MGILLNTSAAGSGDNYNTEKRLSKWQVTISRADLTDKIDIFGWYESGGDGHNIKLFTADSATEATAICTIPVKPKYIYASKTGTSGNALVLIHDINGKD